MHLAWAGPTEAGAPHYYRLQGPRLLIEYDNTQRQANHAHSVWRDPAADFGYDVLGAHLAAHHLVTPQGLSCSSWAARASTVGSPPAGATICRPSGSPWSDPKGTDAAGNPARFHGVVYSQLPTPSMARTQPGPAQVPSGTAGRASVGVSRAS